MYPLKHVFRNWKLFVALLVGITLAATFCASIGVKANISAEEALDKQISVINTDMTFVANMNQTNLPLVCQTLTNVEGVKRVDTVSSFSYLVQTPGDNYTTSYYATAYSFPNTSRINDEWLNKPIGDIPMNYTYIVAGSNLDQQLQVGDNVTVMINFYAPKYWDTTTFYVNLTVAGFAELTDRGYSYLTGNPGPYYSAMGGVSIRPAVSYGGYYSSGSYGYRDNAMIIGWDTTLQNLWGKALESSTLSVSFAVDVDRQSLISPWNIGSSIDSLHVVEQRVHNQLLATSLEYVYINNVLGQHLSTYQGSFSDMVVNFVLVSIPVFFVAWYLGSTVSDVSFNIRRREIGLLSTKGLSSGQIQRMFLTEAVVIGAIGGVLGVIGGLLLNQYYAGTVNLSSLFLGQTFDLTIGVVTIIFAIVLALASVFLSSRKASRIPAVEALRDYTHVESTSRFRWVAWVAVILGSYQIAMFLSGISVERVLELWSVSNSGNIISTVAMPVFGYFNQVMTYLGPFLFVWGITKIVIRDSTKFQAAASKISSVMGDLGALAAKNVRQNPARLAAIAFLIALIIGFSVQVTGQIASQEDFIVRRVRTEVGADVYVTEANATKGQLVLNDILGNVTGIRNATIQRTLNVPISGSYTNMEIRTIDPDTWAKSAYYESDWFTGNPVDEMMRQMKGNNATIILARNIAKQLDLKLWDEITIDFRSCPRTLKIVGFFGPEIDDSSRSTPSWSVGDPSQYLTPMFYSYIPENIFNMTYGSGIYNIEYFSTAYLIKLNSGANGTQVANQIRQVAPTEIISIRSFDQAWRQSESSDNLNTYNSLQVLDIQNIGLVFAVLSASVGMALIAMVSLKERSREATLMSVRGLSYRQLVWMFLIESIAVITFSVILGVVVGTIWAYGGITSNNGSLYVNNLVTQRLIFPADAVATIGVYVTLIYAATIGAILIMSSQYVTKLEKMVRAR